ncbi:glutathione-disulfide reductase [Atopomonas sediminilitoris]|uniref:glutathione-disulfide reductase n=1 Tax=Atopomonas sediminilitoris TaxID=2919919 RepID=UPI001F4E1665|nr:glutathione-disulfide reductase [Atopomonas sediminilitoris]MCJ8169067.1 glutathione-disulfide reductase [Atopomonas sediminilitoris]
MAFDFDLVVIGAGSGGVRCARFAAGFGAKVAVIESRYLGGTCVNVGCVPKKLLVYGAHVREELQLARDYGWAVEAGEVDWPELIARKNTEIERLNGVYRRLLEGSGVTLVEGHGRLLDAHRVQVGDQTLSAERILLAPGGWPQVPDIPGRELAITSNDAFYLPKLPKRVLVVGGGYIAVEFASIFHGMGAQTTLSYRGDLFLRGFDSALRQQLREEFRHKGITLEFNSHVSEIRRGPNDERLVTLADGRVLTVDCVFYATGRRPMLDDLGLENTQVALNERGFIAVDAHYQTAEPSIYAIGDVIGRMALTPVALAEGMAVARQLYQPAEFVAVDYDNIPTAVFSLPNMATVGLTEEQAQAQGLNIKVFQSRFRPMKLSFSDSPEKTLMKLVVDADSDRVLGCHMLGPEAAEIVQGLAVAIKAGATKAVFDQTLGIHPSAAEEFVTMRQPVA